MRNRILFSFLSLLLCSRLAAADNFLKTISGSGNECSSSVAVLRSGDIVTSGVDFSSNDIVLITFNSDGTIRRSQQIGGSGEDEAQAVVATTDGGAVVVGSTTSFGQGNADGFIMKMKESGSLSWKRTFGSAADEHFVRIVQTSDRGFIVLGDISNPATSNDILVVKFNSRGKPVWKKTLSTTGFDHSSGLSLTSDDGALAAFATDVSGALRSVLVKFAANGEVEWSRMYGSSDSHLGLSAVQADDTGYYFTELFTPAGGQTTRTILSKLDSNGVPVWSRQYRSSGSDLTGAVTFNPRDQSLLLTGNISLGGGIVSEGILIGVNLSGKVLWRKRLQPDARPVFIGQPVFSSNDSSVLAVGCAGERAGNDMEILLLKTRDNGKFEGGCSSLSKFSLSSSRFDLTSASFTMQELQVTYTRGKARFTTSTFSAGESLFCSSE